MLRFYDDYAAERSLVPSAAATGPTKALSGLRPQKILPTSKIHAYFDLIYGICRLKVDSPTQHCRVRSTDAGWSSLVARRAHNPKVVGSNPAPATKHKKAARKSGLFCA